VLNDVFDIESTGGTSTAALASWPDFAAHRADSRLHAAAGGRRRRLGDGACAGHAARSQRDRGDAAGGLYPGLRRWIKARPLGPLMMAYAAR